MKPFFPQSIETAEMKLLKAQVEHVVRGGSSIGDSFVKARVDDLQDHDIMTFFIIVMFIEHFIVLFKVYLEEIIQDVPKFVEKKAIKVQHQIEDMGKQQKEADMQGIINKLKLDKKNQHDTFVNVVRQVTEKHS